MVADAFALVPLLLYHTSSDCVRFFAFYFKSVRCGAQRLCVCVFASFSISEEGIAHFVA